MSNTCMRLSVALAGGILAATMSGVRADVTTPTMPNGVAAGDVTPTTAVLWARSTAAGPLTFEVSLSATFDGLRGHFVRSVEDANVPVKVEIETLDPGRTWHYRVTDAAGSTLAGRFRTPHADGRQGFRMGVSGDWRGDLLPYPAIANIPERELDLFVALGDTIYADVPSPDVDLEQAMALGEFRAKYQEVYGTRLGLAAWPAVRCTTALLATIDDHELSNDFAGGAPPPASGFLAESAADHVNDTTVYGTALQAFHEYHPLREEIYDDAVDARFAGKPRLYRVRRYGEDAAVFVLDARSFRDAPLEALMPGAGTGQISDFLDAAFAPGRTMLGRRQLDDLQSDLLATEAAGVTWKFILVPEPIQEFGPFAASDRFEGYAAERAELLSFISDAPITNVVFIAADIHGTVINDVLLRTAPGATPRAIGVFEVTTGPVAYSPPFGPTVFEFVDAAGFGALGDLATGLYALAGRGLKDDLVSLAGNALLGQFDLDPLGLDAMPTTAQLLEGRWLSVHTFGWTEFDVTPDSSQLLITTYGIGWYSPQDLQAQPSRILERYPRIINRLHVTPVCAEGEACNPVLSVAMCGALGAPVMLGLLSALAGLRMRVRAKP